MARQYSQLEQIAYHEAGHAAAASWLRRGFHSVSIEPGSDFLGAVQNTKANFQAIEKARTEGEYGQETRKQRALLEDAVITSLAGER